MSNNQDSNGFIKLVLTGTCASLVSALILHYCIEDGVQGLVSWSRPIKENVDAPDAIIETQKEGPNQGGNEEASDPKLIIPRFNSQLASFQANSLPDPFLSPSIVRQRAPDTVAYAVPVVRDPAKDLHTSNQSTKKEDTTLAQLADSLSGKSSQHLSNESGSPVPQDADPITPKKTESITPKKTKPITPEKTEPIARKEIEPVEQKKNNTITPKKTNLLTPEEMYRISRSRKSVFNWFRERQAYRVASPMQSEAKELIR